MTGILLVNLGTPDAPTRGAVYRYLKQFLLDPRVIDINAIQRNLLVRCIIAPFRSKNAAKLYQKLWMPEGSPLKVYGYKLAEAVQTQLGSDFAVELAMRYQNPSIESALDKLMQKKVKRLIILPLFPQYASASTGSVHEEVMRLLSQYQAIPELHFINSFYDHPRMIEAFVARANEHKLADYDHVMFSYHGIPKRQMIKADISQQHCQKVENCCQQLCVNNQHCYSAQCYATTKALVKGLNLAEGGYTTCFQSRLGRDPWIEPYTIDALKMLREKGVKRLLVLCPAFVADCLETTVEVSDEYAEEFEKLGGEHLQLVTGLNDHPIWVQAVLELIQAQG